MKILIINGIADDPKYMEYEREFENIINSQSINTLLYFKLRDLNINFCTGCWNCWLKTPGICSLKDDQEKILKYIPHVDHILFLSPIILGYESFLIKKFKDRFIPTVQPFIRIYKGEEHHYPRYKNMPKLSFIGIEDELTTIDDIAIIKETYKRVSLNFNSDFYKFYTSKDIGGVKNVLSNF